MCRIFCVVFVCAIASSDLAAHEPPNAQTNRSRDVNVPPPLPAMVRQVVDRAGFEDPTTDFANALVTGPRVRLPFSPAPFLRVGVPNPFELAEQIKPVIPRTAEPGLTPVIVHPRRVKGG
jgi:hypothetical protein